jgi:hypothetical protein
MSRLRTLIAVVSLVFIPAMTPSIVSARNPDYFTIYPGTACYSWFGQSGFYTGGGGQPLAYSQSSKESGTCILQWHVHAYFWGSDNQWHYLENTGYGTFVSVNWTWWTNNVYGYHTYGASPTYTTNAF